MNFKCFYDQWGTIPCVTEVLTETLECQTLNKRNRVVKVNLHVDSNGHVLVLSYDHTFEIIPVYRIFDVRILDQSNVFKKLGDMYRMHLFGNSKSTVYHPMSIIQVDEKVRCTNVFHKDASKIKKFAEALFNLSQNVYVKYPCAYELHMIEREIFVQSALWKLRKPSFMKKTFKKFKNANPEPTVRISNLMRNLTANIPNQKCMKKNARNYLKLYYLKDKDKKFSKKELKRIHIEDLSQDVFLKLTWRMLSVEIFQEEWKQLCASPKDGMSIHEFRRFIRSQNLENSSEEHVTAMAANFSLQDDEFMDKLEWTIFMLSDHCSLVSSSSFSIQDNMDQPFSRYFINSSHNTYLDGHQLFGNSSVFCYRKTLMSGCRCVELDVWDDHSTHEPKITHGNTIVSKISFRDTLAEIKQSAFSTSPYPVIMSIENHCSPEFRKKMADIIQEVLGNMVVSECHPDYPREPNVPLPPPSLFKYKILIKDKLAKPKPNEQNGSTSYDKYVKYFQAHAFTGFDSSMEKGLYYLMSSMDENKSLYFATDHPLSYSRYNEKFMTRVYPMGLRIKSGNYPPMPHWRVGCQLVALNLQTDDEFNRINKAMFEANMNCGYILKPDIPAILSGETKKSFRSYSTYSLDIKCVLCLGTPEHYIKVDYEFIDIFSGQTSTTSYSYIEGDLIRHLNHRVKFMTLSPHFAFFLITFSSLSGEIIGRKILRLGDMRSGLRNFTLIATDGYPLPKAVVFCILTIENINSHCASRASTVSKRDRSELVLFYGKQKENRENALVRCKTMSSISSMKSIDMNIIPIITEHPISESFRNPTSKSLSSRGVSTENFLNLNSNDTNIKRLRQLSSERINQLQLSSCEEVDEGGIDGPDK